MSRILHPLTDTAGKRERESSNKCIYHGMASGRASSNNTRQISVVVLTFATSAWLGTCDVLGAAGAGMGAGAGEGTARSAGATAARSAAAGTVVAVRACEPITSASLSPRSRSLPSADRALPKLFARWCSVSLVLIALWQSATSTSSNRDRASPAKAEPCPVSLRWLPLCCS